MNKNTNSSVNQQVRGMFCKNTRWLWSQSFILNCLRSVFKWNQQASHFDKFLRVFDRLGMQFKLAQKSASSFVFLKTLTKSNKH